MGVGYDIHIFCLLYESGKMIHICFSNLRIPWLSQSLMNIYTPNHIHAVSNLKVRPYSCKPYVQTCQQAINGRYLDSYKHTNIFI